MARPTRRENSPDPAAHFAREKPHKESGMGRLDNNKSVPTNRPDEIAKAVTNKSSPRQLNADDEGGESTTGTTAEERRRAAGVKSKLPPPQSVDHSMKDEEPLGWDQAPTDIKNPRQKRHPKKEGRGGTP